VYSSTSAEATHTDAAVAQSVERRIGSAEVTGPIPVSSFIEKKRKSLNERVCAFLCYGVTVLWYYDKCIVMEVWMRGGYTVEALMLSRGQGGSRKTFLVLRVSTILFYSWTRFLLLCGSGSHFFSSQTRVALPFWHYVNLFLFFPGLARTFSVLRPDFYFYTGLVRTFSRLRPEVLFSSGIMSTFFHSMWVRHALFLLWDFAFSFYQPRIPVCLTILHTFFNTASYLFHIYPVS
jgi:hypothetical protein